MSEEIVRSDFASLKRTIRGLTLYNNCDTVIGSTIAEDGEWAEHELQLCDQFLRPGMVAIDVGAHIGTHAASYARAVAPGGLVFAFEPQRLPFQMLCANAMLNGLDNIFAERAYVGDEPQMREAPNVNPRTPLNHGNWGLHVEFDRGMLYSEVPEISLDDRQFHQVNLIKIDVEGHEPQVIRGALGTIKKHKPVVMFEMNSTDDVARIHEMLTPLGYELHWQFTPSRRKDNHYGNEVDPNYMDKTIIAMPAGSRIDQSEPYQLGDTLEAVVARMTASGK